MGYALNRSAPHEKYAWPDCAGGCRSAGARTCRYTGEQRGELEEPVVDTLVDLIDVLPRTDYVAHAAMLL